MNHKLFKLDGARFKRVPLMVIYKEYSVLVADKRHPGLSSLNPEQKT